MTAHLAYDSPVDHRPRFLNVGLPEDGVMNADVLHALPEDPYWKYEVLDGALTLSSDYRTFTWDDLQTFPDDPHWKYEVLDGALLVTPNAPGLAHQSCALSLAIRFRAVCPPDLKVVIAPFEYKPEGELSVQPDIMIARRPVGEKLLTQTPLLVVEVLSKRTKQMDLTAKRSLYESRGVEHCWIVDPAVDHGGPSIEALRLVDGEYMIAAKADAGQVFEVSEPVPLRFDPAVLLD
jgi:Uma2 family endonuclease